MLATARWDALRGKRLLVVWTGYPEKHDIFQKAKELGVRVALIDNTSFVSRDLVSEIIPVDASRGEESFPAALSAVEESIRAHGKFDGIVTFWEDSVLLTAKLAKALQLRYHSIEAAQAARSKAATREAMRTAGLPTPEFETLRSRADLDKVLERGFPFPAVLKPAYGIEAMSVIKVHSADEARAVFNRVYKEVDPSSDLIFNQGREIVLEEYLDGEEFDMDLLMENGRFVFESVTDNWPTDEPYFVPKGASLPSHASAEKQREMIQAAKQAALAEGFKDGVLHVEGKYTSRGARIIEVNARMGGIWVRDWIRTVWGVDLAVEEMLGAVGIPGEPDKSPEPRNHLEGKFLIPARSGVLEAIEGAIEAAAMPGFYRLLTFKEPGQTVLVPPQGYQRVGMISTQGATTEEAVSRFNQISPKLKVKTRPAEAEVLSLSELAKERPAEEIKREIRDLSLQAGWSQWMGDIDQYLADDPERVLLAFDEHKNLIGYGITDGDYMSEEVPNSEYYAYMVIRPDQRGGGLSKKLFLEGARRAKQRGRHKFFMHCRWQSKQHQIVQYFGRYLKLDYEKEVEPFKEADTSGEKRRVLIVFDLDSPANQFAP